MKVSRDDLLASLDALKELVLSALQRQLRVKYDR